MQSKRFLYFNGIISLKNPNLYRAKSMQLIAYILHVEANMPPIVSYIYGPYPSSDQCISLYYSTTYWNFLDLSIDIYT